MEPKTESEFTKTPNLYILLDNDVDDEFRNYYIEKNNTISRDAGLDLIIHDTDTIYYDDTGLNSHVINLKIKCKMVDEYNNTIAYYMYPRSSISKTPLRLANSVGIIDRDYRGNLMARVDYIGNDNYNIIQGQRLFQICHPQLKSFLVKIVDELDETDRGEGGFGSTGSSW